MLKLSFGLDFADLHQRDGLARLDEQFLHFIAASDPALRDALLAARAAPEALAPKAESELLIALAPQLEDFVAQLFGIEAEARALAEQHHELAPVFSVKRLFVQRQALAKFKPEDVVDLDAEATEQALLGEPFSELAFARRVTAWQEDESAKPPAPARGLRADRHGTDLAGALDEANYCIWCHKQGKDSCSKGLREKAPRGADPASAPFKQIAFGVTLAGCPLEEKISEFHLVKTQGQPIAALAMIVPSTTRWPRPPGTASATTA
jgi:hypothetical protein